MSDKADFYIMRSDNNIEWLGSLYDNGHPAYVADLNGLDEDKFEESVAALLLHEQGVEPHEGWPWPWSSSRNTDYTYVWYQGTLYIAEKGYLVPFIVVGHLMWELWEYFWDNDLYEDPKSGAISYTMPDMSSHRVKNPPEPEEALANALAGSTWKITERAHKYFEVFFEGGTIVQVLPKCEIKFRTRTYACVPEKEIREILNKLDTIRQQS